jgi:hypothetical protein
MRRKSLLIVVALAIALGAAFVAWPRQVDLS